VGVTDANKENARRYAEKYRAPVFSSLEELMESSRPDVVHILTPPQFHYDQALAALDRGIHVLLEKPCTLRSQDLDSLYSHAQANGALLCPDFIQLFTPTFLKAAGLIDSGALGDVVHIESHLSLDLNAPELREAMGLHWSYTLPGGILHNNITHPLYLVLRWLGAPEKISVSATSRGTIPQGVTDHIAVLLQGKACTASFVITGAVKPEPYYVRVFCERGNVLIDFDSSTVSTTQAGFLPRFLRRAPANFSQAYQLSAAGLDNLVKFLRGRLLPYQGLENLIPRFYDSIRNGDVSPVSKELALTVAQAEEAIFAEAGKLHIDTRPRLSRQEHVRRPDKVLITGATGYLGVAVARKLIDEGYRIRALVRPLSHTDLLEEIGVELAYGDIRDSESVAQACSGMDIVIHLAAALRGSTEFVKDCAVKGTGNIAAAAKRCGLQRVIYMSSMSVYDFLQLREGELISEESPLEQFPESRGTYSLAKRMAEAEALAHISDSAPAWSILRPSVVVGNNHDLFSPVGKKLGSFLLSPGSPSKILRLIHVDDVAAAVAALVQNDGTRGRIFNLSDKKITQCDYIAQLLRHESGARLRVVYIPYWIAASAAASLRWLRLLSRRVPDISQNRLAYLYRSVEANSRTLHLQTGWQPRGNLLQTLVEG
jgi:predicted dehydrogenase/nucleoside-diphosphate-sugar epimerase